LGGSATSAILTTLVSFSVDASGTPGINGAEPDGGLIADSNGDLFGTNSTGGVGGAGTVFEIKKTTAGYASVPTTLVSFKGDDGDNPEASPIADANGDLFGTTSGYDQIIGDILTSGTVFEVERTAAGYASAPATLVSFNGANGANPFASLIADVNGDLLGVTEFGGANNDGTVFEIKKTAAGYASAPTTLVSFNGDDGRNLVAGLIADANGDLFGATEAGGANDDGTVFEIAKTAGGYASTPTTLVSFNGATGSVPDASLFADANGDLFGTNSTEGVGGAGTVFEIKKTAAGYASTPTILVSFNGDDGDDPEETSLIADANGDLFGTTEVGGANDEGTAFEIKKTAAGYASAPTTLVSFNGDDGSFPVASLLADANGDLFGTTVDGGPNGGLSDGTVFEITGSGFVTTASATPKSDGILFQNTGGQAAIWGMDGTSVIAGGAVSPNPGPAWKAVGTGDFNDDGLPDLLWQNANGQAAIWDMDGTSLIGGGAVTPNPGPSWKAIGTGDFNHDGFSDDILWQNTSTGQASIWEMSGASLIGGGAVTPNPGPAWKAIGTGDFNHDGFSDVLWQNTNSGQVSIWEMNGNTLIGGGAVSPNPGPSWKAIGTGDFNHDGFSDILWQNTNSGQVSIWEMNGNTLIGGGAVSPNPGPSWKAIGTGDFNDDGRSDILLQSTSGQTSIWDMNGNTIIGGGAVSANAGPSWHAVGLT
jgi:uncharacterized repeat protein (TIGR03803 family)